MKSKGQKDSIYAPTAIVLERVTEESWFFKLSEFQDRLLKLYEEHPVRRA